MKKSLIVALLAVVLCSSGAFGQGEFPLVEKEVRGDQPSPSMFWAYLGLYGRSEKPAKVKAIPEVAGEAYYATTQIAGRPVQALLDIFAEPKIYFDTDGDGDLSDEQPVVGKATVRSRRGSQGGLLRTLLGGSKPRPRSQDLKFPPFTLRLTEPQLELRLAGSGRARPDYVYVNLRPAVVRSGTVELGGTTCKLEIADANLDGRYDGVFTPESYRQCDGLAIDLNGDGKFPRGYLNSPEVLPLPRMLQADGVYYSVKVAPDGASIRFDPVEPRFGTLEVGTQDADLRLLSDCGNHQLKKGEGPWRLPEGRYSAMEVKLTRKQDKVTWGIQSSGNTGKLRNFAVEGDKTTSLALGPPLVGSTDMRQYGNSVSISYSVAGQAGETYMAGATRNGKTLPAPKFKIVTESEKVLLSKAFEYG